MSVTCTSRVGNLLGALALAVVDDLRVTTSDAAVVQLADHPGITISDLGRRTALTHSAAVRMVEQLEARGLVVRGRSEVDRRAVVLTLTSAGHEQAAKILAARSEVLTAALESLTRDDREQLERLLEAVLDTVTRSADHATLICRFCDLQACPQRRCPVELKYCSTSNRDPRPVPGAARSGFGRIGEERDISGYQPLPSLGRGTATHCRRPVRLLSATCEAWRRPEVRSMMGWPTTRGQGGLR
jgi:MarR family transcriptional regulator, negative regulator of the multidrug operon emrRAB